MTRARQAVAVVRGQTVTTELSARVRHHHTSLCFCSAQANSSDGINYLFMVERMGSDYWSCHYRCDQARPEHLSPAAFGRLCKPP